MTALLFQGLEKFSKVLIFNLVSPTAMLIILVCVIHLAWFSLCISHTVFSCYFPCPSYRCDLHFQFLGLSNMRCVISCLSHGEIGTSFLSGAELILRPLYFSFVPINLLYEFPKAAVTESDQLQGLKDHSSIILLFHSIEVFVLFWWLRSIFPCPFIL